MENIVVTERVSANSRTRKLYKKKVPEPNLKLSPRGTGPFHISVLMKPLCEIINHPEREKLLAEFFQQNESEQSCL